MPYGTASVTPARPAKKHTSQNWRLLSARLSTSEIIMRMNSAPAVTGASSSQYSSEQDPPPQGSSSSDPSSSQAGISHEWRGADIRDANAKHNWGR